MRLVDCLLSVPKWGVTILMVSCATNQETKVDQYFSIPEFMDEQAVFLEKEENQLSKTVSFGDDTESTTAVNLDIDQLNKEFKIFKEHDINKPVLVDAYHTEEETNQDGGRTTSYSLIDQSASGVLNMQIQYDSLEQVSSWKSSFKEENLLYCNFRELALSTDKAGILKSYLIQGYHKLMFKDTVYYQLQVDISY